MEMRQFLQFKKNPEFIGDETQNSKASLEKALFLAAGVTTENRTVCFLIFQKITYEENNLSCC